MHPVDRALPSLRRRLRGGASSLRPRASSSLAISCLASAALLGAACSSELGGGTGSDGVPRFGGDPGFQGFDPNGSGNGNGDQGGGDFGNGDQSIDEGNPNDPDRAESEPVINGTGDTGSLIDENGEPLSIDQLPALRDCRTPGPRAIRRLTNEQYVNTLRQVFGGQNVPDSSPLIDASALGYNVDADQNIVAGTSAESLESLAAQVAENARNNGFINQLTNGCNDRNNGQCTRQFVENLGERIARGPFPGERVQAYVELFNLQVDGVSLVDSFDDGAELVMQAMIQSPYMIYRRELGNQQGGEFQLTPFEVASELSYFLTNQPPDDQLMQAAENNQLQTADQIEAQAERLLQTDAAAAMLTRFVLEWLDVDGLPTKVKDVPNQDLPDGIRQAMLRETQELFLDVFDSGGTIGDLLSANYTYVNQELAGFYGIPGGGPGDDFQRVGLDGTDRIPGLLGHGAFLAEHALSNNSSPVQRALIVRERMLCDPMGPVPSGLDTNLRPPDPSMTNRQRYAVHSENEPCRSCHQLMDPIGFSFENFDSFGRYRDTEANQPVDSSGGVPLRENGLLVTTVPVDDAAGLADYLSRAEQVRACLANNLAYYSHGMANDDKWPEDVRVCNDHAIRQVARDSNNTLRSVLTGILRAPHFTRRVQDR